MTGPRGCALAALVTVALAACGPRPMPVASPATEAAIAADPDPTAPAQKRMNDLIAHPDAIALVPAYPEAPLMGPAAAKGAIIYNHGYDYDEDTSGEPPFFLDRVREAGWDVFTLLRPVLEDRDERGPAILEDKARSLRQQGYRRIVAVGQSYGAWISIEVAAHPGVLDAIIAMSPARYGEVPPASLRNAEIVDISAKMAPTPTLMFLFAGDDFDPGGRGAGFTRILAAKGAGYAVVDQPAGFTGHSVGLSTAFAEVFAPCIIDFLAAPPPPGAFTCTPHRPSTAEVLSRFRKVERETAIAHSIASPFLGHWYGWYTGGGREALLSVEHVTADGRMDGTYAFGVAHHGEKGGAYAVTGDVLNDVLHVTTPHSQLEGRLRADGRLDLRWSTAGGSGATVLRKLDGSDE